MPTVSFLSDEYLSRVKRSYRLSIENWSGINHFFWGEIFERQRPVHDALMADDNDLLRNIFMNPGATDLYYGVDGLFEQALATPDGDRIASEVCEKLLKDVIAITGQNDIEFPNPFPSEFGFRTANGIASVRAINAAYQAWMIRGILSDRGGSVVEIGPGMGRTAYYAFKSGFRYATIDLPMGVVAQACFLGATLGPSKVWLLGDSPNADAVRLFPASKELPRERFDLAMNVDSMPEMSHRAAADYIGWIGSHASWFLSINHALNDLNVATLFERYVDAERTRQEDYLIRPGYLIELYSVRRKKGFASARYAFHRLWDSISYRLQRTGS